jgi:hypothetical protein
MSGRLCVRGLIALFSSCSLVAQCRLPDSVLSGFLQRLDSLPGHPVAGALKIDFINRGDVVLFWLPSVRRADSEGHSLDITYLWYFYPVQPRLSWTVGWNTAVARGLDFVAKVNEKYESRQQTRSRTPAARAEPGHLYPAVRLGRREEATQKALDVKYPACSMRPVLYQPEPELRSPVARSEICSIERDWRDVHPAPSVPWAPSPSGDPVREAMIKAIVRAVARAGFEDPGRNRILVHEFNVEDERTSAFLVSPKGEVLQRFGVRLDKNDPCLAEAQVISGGCSPCPMTDDKETLKQTVQAYP